MMNMNYKIANIVSLPLFIPDRQTELDTHNSKNSHRKSRFKKLTASLSRSLINYSRWIEPSTSSRRAAIDNRDSHHRADEEDVEDDGDGGEEGYAGCTAGYERADEGVGHC